MKQIIFLLLLLGSFPLFSQNEITIKVTETSLEKVILELEKNYGFLFSFAENDITGIQVSIKADQEAALIFFQKLAAQTPLNFEIVNENYVIITQKKEANEVKEKLTQICGKILDKTTQTPLPYANVYFKKSQIGMYAKANGDFVLAANLSILDTLIISYVGYQEQRLPTTFFPKNPCPVIELDYTFLPDQIVVVKDYLTDGIDLADNGLSTNIRPARLGNLPGQAEPDVLKTIQFLPGISSPDDASSSIYIRGGTPDQNLILWEDIPIYHTAHYFGLISAFNPYILDEVQVYRSGFGAQYGGRTAGIIDLKTNDYKQPTPAFGAGINPTMGYIFGKIPLKKEQASAIFSMRHSITKIWETPTYKNLTNRALQGISFGKFNNIRKLPNQTTFDHQFDFFDANLKIATDIGKQTNAAISLFYNKNHLDNFFHDRKSTLVQRDSFDLKHQGASVAIKQTWTERFSSKFTVVTSGFEYDYLHRENKMPPNQRNDFTAKMSQIEEQQFLFANKHQLPKNFQLKWGYQFTNYDVDSGYEESRKNRPPVGEGLKASGKLQTLFGEISTNKEQRMSAELGLRYSYYTPLKKSYLEPRFHLKFAATDALNLQLNAGKYHQFLNQRIELQLNRSRLLSNSIWVLANNGQSPVVDAFQYQIGGIFSKNSWVIDLQGYYKKVTGITSASLGFQLLPQAGYDLGQSEIKGVDLLLKKRWKNYRSWISYSLSKVDYAFDNYAETTFPAAYDQRHSFSWANLLTYQNWEFSLGFSLTSGTPYTVITDYELLPNPTPSPPIVDANYESINGQNLPFNHHLDASVFYHFSPKNIKHWSGHFGLSVYNLYNQQNIHTREYSVIVEGDNQGIEFADYKTLGFTPNLVFRVEWR